jgi:hypothetical protein
MKACKVVRRNPEGGFLPIQEFSPIYQMGAVTTPDPGAGPLCAVATIEHAVAFLLGGVGPVNAIAGLVRGDYVILGCEVEPWVEPLRIRGDLMIATWTADRLGVDISSLPEGTILCRAIRPVRALRLEDIEPYLDAGVTTDTRISDFAEPAVLVRVGRDVKAFPVLSRELVDLVPRDSRMWEVLRTANTMAETINASIRARAW